MVRAERESCEGRWSEQRESCEGRWSEQRESHVKEVVRAERVM